MDASKQFIHDNEEEYENRFIDSFVFTILWFDDSVARSLHERCSVLVCRHNTNVYIVHNYYTGITTSQMTSFLLQNIFRITTAYYRLCFDRTEYIHATYIEYLTRREGLSRYMEQEEVEAWARKLVKLLL